MSDHADELPEDPWVNQDMLPMAKSAHELFVAFMAAGFTESQAIQIVTGVITNLLMNTAPPNQGLCDRIGLSASGTTQGRILSNWAHGAWCR